MQGSSTTTDEIPAGTKLGKYEILRKLAVGGMAQIYLARVLGTAGFEKVVVLKRILPSVADDRAFVTMFLDEARLAATLRHSNIADVFDVGAENNSYFFAMEYIQGQDARAVRLEAHRRQQTIPHAIALAIACGTAAALAYAHDKAGPRGSLGLVHRDVSPSNILISYDGAVKLVDFGIARASSRNVKTQTGMLKGKVPYMSPEQCRGQVLDRRSDLFSLGIVLYELTTGVRPFRGKNEYEIMSQIVNAAAPPPSSVTELYPKPLEAIVMRLLARTRVDRYQTADALLEDLERVQVSLELFPSALAVARYMRELFAEQLAASEGEAPRDRIATKPFHDPALVRATTPAHEVTTTRAYPAGHPPSSLLEANVRTSQTAYYAELTMPASRDQPDVASPPASEPDPRMEAPTTPQGTPVVFAPPAIHAASASPFAGETRLDVILPFDPIDARSAEILDEVDATAPADEPDADRTPRRIAALLDRGLAWHGTGELERAVAAIDLAMSEDPDNAIAQELLGRHREAIATVFDKYLGDPAGQLALARPLEELANVPLSPRAAFLLSRLDGVVSIGELLDISGMARLETQRYLCQLFLRGVLVVA